MHEFDRMHLWNRAHELKHEPLLLHESKFGYPMHLLIEVVAYKLSHAKHRFLLYIEYLVVYEHVRVLVQVESVTNPIEVRLELSKPVVLYFWKVQFAKNWAFIFKGRDERIENFCVAYRKIYKILLLTDAFIVGEWR